MGFALCLPGGIATTVSLAAELIFPFALIAVTT
jgi:hypothetical protein